MHANRGPSYTTGFDYTNKDAAGQQATAMVTLNVGEQVLHPMAMD
jgi:hypothetical protein